MIRQTSALSAALLLLLAAAGCADPAAENAAKAQAILAQFEGQWEVASLTPAGGSSKDNIVSVQEGRFVLARVGAAKGAGGGGAVVGVREMKSEIYALQVDPSKGSGQIDFAFAAGERLGQTRAGLYAFEGDTLKISMAEPGAPRPAGLDPAEKVTTLSLRRLK